MKFPSRLTWKQLLPRGCHVRLGFSICWGCWILASFMTAGAQDVPAGGESSPTPVQSDGADSQAVPPTAQLVLSQGRLADKLQRLEALMLKMAEYESTENPRRSALLKEAITLSQDRHLGLQMETLVKLLTDQRYQRAIENQQMVVGDLQGLLELLLKEDRADQLQNEQARLREYLQQLDRILRQQRGVRGQTEAGDNPLRLADLQGQIADQTGQLQDLMDKQEGTGGTAQDGADTEEPSSRGEAHDEQPADSSGESDESSGQPSEGQPSEGQPSEGQPSEGQPSEGQPSEGQPSEGQPSEGQPSEGQPSEGQPSEGQPSEGQPSEGQPSEGQPSEGQPSEGQPSQGQPSTSPPGPSFPGRERIAEAQQRMREAQERLEDAQRRQAVEEQQEATRLLEQAKAELEAILRQLREEEIQQTLTLLEARFRKMLEMQLGVNETTQQLDQVTATARDRQFAVRVNKLAGDQRAVELEADKAWMLLREEGSSVAFPEAVQQLKEEMAESAEWIRQQKLGELTQSVQEDIVAGLKEMLEALQMEIRNAEERRQQQQPQQPGQSPAGEEPLVNQLAELRMIRTLQVRVNRQTTRLSRLLDDVDDPVGQALQQDVVTSLKDLGDRELRIQEITRDIVLGKNQ